LIGDRDLRPEQLAPIAVYWCRAGGRSVGNLAGAISPLGVLLEAMTLFFELFFFVSFLSRSRLG
jgi:hypothetical protein